MTKGAAIMRSLGFSIVFLMASAAVAGSAPPASRAAAAGALESLPAWFEPNPGLYGEQVRYVSRGEGYTLLLDAEGAVVALDGGRAWRGSAWSCWARAPPGGSNRWI